MFPLHSVIPNAFLYPLVCLSDPTALKLIDAYEIVTYINCR